MDQAWKISSMKATTTHLFTTVLVLTGLAIPTFWYWFPPGLTELAGGAKLFGLLALGLLLCGPLLTALLNRPGKSKRALAVDWVLIGVLQTGVLLLGVNALVQSRPLALVFETDRFRVVTYADIPSEALHDLTQWAEPWSLRGFITVGIRPPNSDQERIQRLDDVLWDISPSQRPMYWKEYTQFEFQIRQRARPLADLRAAYPAQLEMIERFTGSAVDNKLSPGKVCPVECIWLPLVGRHSLDWIVLLDPGSLAVKAFLPLDGFI